MFYSSVFYRAEYRQAMMSMSSTLVETVSIDYEDFNESFLTCGTCLCKFSILFVLVAVALMTSLPSLLLSSEWQGNRSVCDMGYSAGFVLSD